MRPYIDLPEREACVLWFLHASREGAARAGKERAAIFTSSSHWTIKAEGADDGTQSQQPAVDLWLYSNRAAVHKSQAELLTVNRACQHAQLIQRLCQAIVILCIQTGGPDSPYTAVNGCICQWGFVALAAMEALSIIYWRRWVIGFVSSLPFCRGDVSTQISFS